jgi:benzoyl-CoA reductase/2-hydroxyglutaryl-CoA dehydratase subunit BcrC/BadD/HgdB
VEVFFTSPWVPAEWIAAHGLTPRGWPGGVERARPTAAGVCPFAQAFQQFTAEQSAAAVVFTTTCDQMRRAPEATAGGGARRFLFNVPATWQSPVARQLYRAEVERLGRFLTNLGGRAPARTRLAEVMAERDQARARLREALPDLPARAAAEAIARFHWDGSIQLPGPPAGPPPQGRPVALVGGPLDRNHWALLDGVEAAGGRVAVNGTDSGERSLLPQYAPASDPLEALVEGYCGHLAEVSQRPNTRLYQWLERRLRESAARGIIVWTWLACDLWRAEVASLREAFQRPVLLLEADEAAGVSPRERSRLQAFLEMLQ